MMTLHPPVLYCDTRLGGIERWILGDPGDAYMRVHDATTSCVCFLCVEEMHQGQKKQRYGGTAFFVSVPSEVVDDREHLYLVTAKHCVVKAKERGTLYLRLNISQGGAKMVEAETGWVFPDSDGADVAILPLPPEIIDGPFEVVCIPRDMFATDEVVKEKAIGIGDELMISGLFTRRHGTQRNLPIIRAGIIASMPDEPLQDIDTGLDYQGYLAEVRSIGGLSGSPVFVIIEVLHARPGGAPIQGGIYLLGLIRGHWDYHSQSAPVDFLDDELRAVNMGIAIVTPIQEVVQILDGEELKNQRRQRDRIAQRQSAPTLD
jgi:hypothetical protein